MSLNFKSVASLSHHEQRETCSLRPRYRQGRKDTAVKVYTINLESRYLLLMGVPAVGVKDELEKKCREFGDLVHFYVLDEYPCEEFTEVYLVSYTKLQSARVAKRKLDARSFFGGVLHVCFAPEFESVEETRNKLIERQRYVAYASGTRDSGPFEVRTCRKKDSDVSSVPPVESEPPEASSSKEVTYIWAGKTYTMPQPAFDPFPSTVSEPSLEGSEEVRSETTRFVPRQLRPVKGMSEDDTLTSTSSIIRRRIASLGAPNPTVSFKKRKT